MATQGLEAQAIEKCLSSEALVPVSYSAAVMSHGSGHSPVKQGVSEGL
jgi:hypothetical protein